MDLKSIWNYKDCNENWKSSTQNDSKAPRKSTAVIPSKYLQWQMPSRYVIATLGFMSCTVLTSQRLNLSMALVAMVNRTVVVKNAQPNASEQCNAWSVNEIKNDTEEIERISKGEFAWDSEIQGHIIGASFLGFVLTNFPGGRLSETIGAKQILMFSIACASLCNILSPLVSTCGAYALLGMQLIKGMSQGLTQPAISCMMAKWFPKTEKGFLSSISFSGYPAGAVVGGLLSGMLCDSSFLGGWPLVFYVFGFIGLILTVCLYYYASNSPEAHDTISKEELKYIISYRDSPSIETRQDIPWKAMMSDKATWALFIGMFGQYWLTFYFVSVHPTYLGIILHFTNTENGYLNSIPYIGQIIAALASSYISDWFVNNNYATTNVMRKVCNSLSCIGFSVSLIVVSYVGCDHQMNMILFVVAITAVGFGFPGCCIVPIDMSLAFAGTLMGITCTVASTSGFIIPLMVGAFTNNQQTFNQWRKVLYISAGVGLISGLVFNIFGSATLQKWDAPNDSESKKGVNNEAFEQSIEPSKTSSVNVPKSDIYNISVFIVERM